MSLGENIYKLRKEKKLSQEKLAEKINVTRQTISNWELNVTQPNPDQLKLLSISLEASIDSLLNNEFKSSPEIENTQDEASIEVSKPNKKPFIVILSIMFFIIIIVLSFILIISLNNKENTPSSTSYSVVYNSQNDSPLEAYIVDAGSLLKEPEIKPQKSGYLFEGWYYNGIKWDYSKDKVNSNIILDAKYTVIGALEVIDNLLAYIANMDTTYTYEKSFDHNQIFDSSFYTLGSICSVKNHLLGDYRLVLETMYSGKGNVSILGIKVDKPCIIEFQIATESNYGYTSTLSEIYLKNNNGVYSYTKGNNIGQSSTNARLTTVYYEYDGSTPKTLYFGVFDRNMGIFNIKILQK